MFGVTAIDDRYTAAIECVAKYSWLHSVIIKTEDLDSFIISLIWC